MANPIITKIGNVSAYLDAIAHGFEGTRAEFGELLANSANYAQSAKSAASAASASATTATTKAGEATTAATAAQTAKTQTEASATTASTKAAEASASATSAGQSATNAAASATSAAQSASNAQNVLDSIPADYSKMSADVSQLKADLNDIATIELPKTQFNPLYGKKLCCDGDSIMCGAGYTGGFAKLIGEANNMTVQNIAVSGGTIRSGTTWSDGNNRHWICETLQTLDSDGDYYIFDGFVNDVNSQTTIGSVSWGYSNTLDTTTFCGAFEQCCKTLCTTFAGKKVGYVFIHRIWKPTDTLVPSFIDKMKEILEKWGVPYIDLITLNPPINDIEALKTAYTQRGDGWHPNEQGYKLFYVDKITAWLKTL